MLNEEQNSTVLTEIQTGENHVSPEVEENIENLLTMFRNTYSNDQLIELLYSQFQKGK